jgi:putative membrane protein
MLGALLALGAFYGAGVVRAWQHAGRGRIVRRWQPPCFAAALLTTAIALASGLDRAAGRSLTAHMTQHVLLISVAAPLFAISAPLLAGVYALDLAPSSRRVGRHLHRLGGRGRTAVLLVTALLLHTAAVGLWHVPSWYGAALRNPLLHAFEHASFLFTAVFLWWAAIGAGRGLARGAGVLALFVTTLPMNALGVLMTLARTPWYSAYVHHASTAAALDDQALAGVVMWGFGGVAALVGAFALFVAWLDGMERANPSRGRGPTGPSVPAATAPSVTVPMRPTANGTSP